MLSLAQRLAEVSQLTGTFRLRSGTVSSTYFDKYQFETSPDLLRTVAEALCPLIPLDAQVLAGLELGGIPLAVMLSQRTGLPTVFVRKAPKAYGTCRQIEGQEVAWRHIVLVEDIVTSGGQVIDAAHVLRDAGAAVTHAVCVIDREAGGRAALEAQGIILLALFRMHELDNAGPRHP